jgi:hypothetical protein
MHGVIDAFLEVPRKIVIGTKVVGENPFCHRHSLPVQLSR